MNLFDPLSRAPNHMDLCWRAAGQRRLEFRLHAGRAVGSWAHQPTHSPLILSFQHVFESKKEPTWNWWRKTENTWKCYFEAYGTQINEHINYSIIYGILNILSFSPLLPLCYDSVSSQELRDLSERCWKSTLHFPGALMKSQMCWPGSGQMKVILSLSCLHHFIP